MEGAAKGNGSAIFGYDVRVPGMLYGAVARPPRYQATLAAAGPGTAASLPGVVKVVLQPGFAGVVAKTTLAARQAVACLELTWVGGTTIGMKDLEALVTAKDEGVVVHAGAVVAAGPGDRVLERQFRTPLAAHSSMEPQAAMVDCSGPRVVAKVSTQIPSMAIEAIAAATGRPASEIDLTPTLLGGGFGRKGGHDVGREAALLSLAAGAPVLVGWTREEELRHDYFRPPTHHRLRAVIGSNGAIRSVEHHLASGDVALSFGANPLPGGELGARLIGFDPGTAISLAGPYAFPNLRVTITRVKLPVPTGSWRGLGANPNTFALESFVDELAHEVRVDPIDFRLEYLDHDERGARLRALLGAVRRSSAWDARGARALGVACGEYHGTPVATVAEAELEDGVPRVRKLFMAVDPGLLINPDGARAQVEGGASWGVSAALLEQITVENGMAVEQNFTTYRFARMTDVPQVEIEFLSSGDEPRGLGEAPLIAVAAAIRGALRQLGVTQLDRIPLAR